jgi:hypothetical protein
MELICIDDKNKPHDIPNNCWIKENEVYTAIGIAKDGFQNVYCVSLAEVEPPSPYTGYKLSRFLPIDQIDISEAMERIKEDYHAV